MARFNVDYLLLYFLAMSVLVSFTRGSKDEEGVAVPIGCESLEPDQATRWRPTRLVDSVQDAGSRSFA